MVAYDVGTTTGALSRHWLHFLVLLLLLVDLCILPKDVVFDSFTHLGHWLRLVLEKEEHLPSVFCTENGTWHTSDVSIKYVSVLPRLVALVTLGSFQIIGRLLRLPQFLVTFGQLPNKSVPTYS